MINREWHEGHVLGKGASLDARVEWHQGHAQACSCRSIPESIRAEIRRREAATGGSDASPGDTNQC